VEVSGRGRRAACASTRSAVRTEARACGPMLPMTHPAPVRCGDGCPLGAARRPPAQPTRRKHRPATGSDRQLPATQRSANHGAVETEPMSMPVRGAAGVRPRVPREPARNATVTEGSDRCARQALGAPVARCRTSCVCRNPQAAVRRWREYPLDREGHRTLVRMRSSLAHRRGYGVPPEQRQPPQSLLKRRPAARRSTLDGTSHGTSPGLRGVRVRGRAVIAGRVAGTLSPCSPPARVAAG
jgi:hypothetical protein